MRSIIYAVAVSLDGYLAGPQGEFDWIPMDPEIDFAALFARFDTLLMGRRTYEAARAHGSPGTPGVRTVVVSRTLRPQDHPDVTLFTDDVALAVARLRDEPGKDIWLFGGGLLFRSVLKLGLVDRVELAVVPVLLGGGIPFLAPGAPRTRLRLLGSKVYQATGIVLLEYAAVPVAS